MISSIRKAVQSPVMKVFLGIIVLSFAALPLSGVFVGAGSSAVASVDGYDITPQEYARAVQVELNRLNQGQTAPININDFRAFGGYQFLLDQMIRDAAIQNEANALGISLPDDVIKEHIVTMSAFQGLSGQFSQEQFRDILRRNGLSTTEFANMLRSDLVHQMLLEGISVMGRAPNSVLEAVAKFQEEERTFSYLELPLSLVEMPEMPAMDVLTAYYEENKEIYKSPEYRRAQVLFVNRDDILRDAEITEEDLERTYKRRLQSYQTPERRQLEQIIFDTQEKADNTVKRLMEGELFEKIAIEEGRQPTDINLGYVIKSDLLPEVAEAAFYTDKPGIIGPVETDFGYAVLNVQAIQPSSTRAFEDVRNELMVDMEAEQIARRLPEFLDLIEDSRAAGATLEEIAEDNGFVFHRITLDASGTAPDGMRLPEALPPIDLLTNDVFQAEVEEEQLSQEIPLEGVYAIHVEDILAPQERPLSDIKERVADDWKRQERDRRLTELVDKFAQTPDVFEVVSEEYEIERLKTSRLKRNSLQTSFSGELFNTLFQTEAGGIVTGRGQSPDVAIIARIDEVYVPSQDQITSTLTDLKASTTQAIQQDIGVLFAQELVDRQDVEVNNTALQDTLERVQTY